MDERAAGRDGVGTQSILGDWRERSQRVNLVYVNKKQLV